MLANLQYQSYGIDTLPSGPPLDHTIYYNCPLSCVLLTHILPADISLLDPDHHGRWLGHTRGLLFHDPWLRDDLPRRSSGGIEGQCFTSIKYRQLTTV